ncbi:hypothetical protein ABEV41_10175 [Geobacillus thermodenitrificans]|jgi:hypothetical protein|uniref:hypothetical protein n=1 Tax=Geobacillus thermodenitrificans TaxID=33940 RepID=UPI000C28C20D|nr:hypothetical protein CV632_06805 [Geobacillus thermodenitrificans]
MPAIQKYRSQINDHPDSLALVVAMIGLPGEEGEAMRLAEPIVDMALAFIVFGVLVGRWLVCRGLLLTSLPDIMRSRFPPKMSGFSLL